MKNADIAIVGWHVRLPGASTIEEYWQNLRSGVESITRFTDADLAAVGYQADPSGGTHFVPAAPIINGVEDFDASFFGVSPRDAEIIDPQYRLFLEETWSALEDAGYDAEQYPGRIGVFAGANISRYLLDSLKPVMDQDPSRVGSIVMALCFNDKDALATLVSYKLNLTGPSVNVQSFCSTSLVAVHLGCQSLRLGESDMVVAGGSNLHARNPVGYNYREGDILSPDGHCRAFDAQGRGTVFGSGVGAVVLKRLDDALADGDTVHVVIKGSAVNNDGSSKAGYTAPSLEGQAAAVARALEMADVDPATIGFVEAHGTGTEVGDPIEVNALTRAYRRHTDARTYCALGSVKTNFGHLDRAAGVSSLVKGALAVKYGQVPPTLHFKTPNPKIDFAGSPFFVNNQLIDWPLKDGRRRAGVSGLGFGGTNAHVILEQAPDPIPSAQGWPVQILPISARTETALPVAMANLAKHLQRHPDVVLADVAWTLQSGRRAFPHRAAVVCADAEEAISKIESGAIIAGEEMVAGARPLVWLFPGQGAQYVNMGRGLYDAVPAFRECVDRCADLLTPHLGHDLRSMLYPADESRLDEATVQLQQTANTQPALFVVEYALATLFEQWGLKPAGMIGHSVGEYVAACLAGVFSLEDALLLVATRGRLMQSCDAGAMLAVLAEESVVRSHVGTDVALAAVNAPGTSVLSGTFEAIAAVEKALTDAGISSRRLETSHAFHSAMMDGILDEFRTVVSGLTLSAPTRPFVSNVSGRWIEAGEATDPAYWVRHLREAVRFSDGLTTLTQESGVALVEVGPGGTLLSFAKRILGRTADAPLVQTLRQRKETRPDLQVLLESIARLWVSGVVPQWSGLHEGERRQRVPLPTYPFERTSFWLEPERRAAVPVEHPAEDKLSDIADWFHVPTWTPAPASVGSGKGDGRPWLVLGDSAFADALERQLIEGGATVTRAAFGRTFRPGHPEDMTALFDKWRDGTGLPGYVIHAGNVIYGAPLTKPSEVQDRAFFSTVSLIQELGRLSLSAPVRVGVVSDRLFGIDGTLGVSPERATLLGPCRVTPREHADIQTTAIDLPEITPANEQVLAECVIAEMTGGAADTVVGYRGASGDPQRWVQTLVRTRVAKPAAGTLPLKAGGCYVVTGGTGGIGLTVAEHLARQYQANLVLTSRSGMPAAGSARAEQMRGRVQAMEAQGGTVTVVRADVADAAAMVAVLDDAEKRHGRVDGIFHTAGVPGGGVIQRKKPDVAAKVLDPKVKGTLVLDGWLQQRRPGQAPDFVVLFSSAAAVAGPFGQVDYCAANAFLDTFAASRQGRTSTVWTSIDWDDWAEVGMAVETSSRLGAEGDAEAIEHPLFSRREQRGTATTLVATLGDGRDWLLEEHVLFGERTVPGSAYLEFARAAYACVTGDESCEMTDLFVLAPMMVPVGTTRDLRVVLEPREDRYQFVIESGAGADRLEHVRGTIGALDATTGTDGANGEVRHDLVALRATCNEQEIGLDVLADYRAAKEGGYLALGPRWNNTQRVFYGPSMMLAEHELAPDYQDDVLRFKLHPAFTDFTALFPLYLSQSPSQYVPFSYDAVRVRGPLPARVSSWTHVKDSIENTPRAIRFDCRFMDESGRELLEIDNLVLHLMEGTVRSEVADPTSPNFTLAITTPGVLDSLEAQPTDRRAPEAGEVEIQVAAAGLNFRDVLRALGMLSDEHDAGAAVVGFGAECSGKIVRVGAGVEGLSVGDDVLAFSTKSFSGFVTTSAKAVAPIPPGMGFAQAASIPMVFLTAYHALHGLARVRKGDRVLIHAAAGGVGLAAVQIARMHGADVIATVGSQAKRDYLESIGVTQISTSRSLDFVEDVRRFTQDQGVDVVLNALAGDFIPASLGLLRTGGRFIEIGARDIYQNSQIGLRPFANNLTFSAFDLGQVAASDPDYLRGMLGDVLAAFDRGDLQLLPIETYPTDNAAAAFQYMAAARHIGKVVVSIATMKRSERARPTVTAPVGSGRDLSHGIRPVEGMDALERAMALGQPHVVVTTRPLPSAKSERPAPESAAPPPPTRARKFHPRPALPTPYRAPETAEERAVEALWRDLLGIEMIGVDDSFFELGGDSLLGVQLISVMKSRHTEFADNIRPADLYEGPTIRQLARKLAGDRGEGPDESEGRKRAEGRREMRARRRNRSERTSE